LSDGYSPVRKLLATDQVDAFDCGQAALNQFLQRYALINQKTNSAQTYVCCQSEVVVGFYSLAVGSVNPEAAPSRVMKGLARHPVPVMILAQLAVDKDHQRQGLGQALLKDALLRTAKAADIAGIRCLLVHAKDDALRQWYESWEFEPSRYVPSVPDAQGPQEFAELIPISARCSSQSSAVPDAKSNSVTFEGSVSSRNGALPLTLCDRHRTSQREPVEPLSGAIGRG